MNLNEYLVTDGSLSVSQIAKIIGAKSSAQIRQWQHGYAGRRPGPAHCLAIERATKGIVTRQELRPNDYWLIWPDLEAPSLANTAQPATENVAQGVVHV